MECKEHLPQESHGRPTSVYSKYESRYLNERGGCEFYHDAS